MSNHLSRRFFIGAGLISLAAAACNMPLRRTVPTAPVIQTGDATQSAPPTPALPALTFPDVAGVITAFANSTITLQGVGGVITYALDPNVVVQDSSDQLTTLRLGQNVAVSLDESQSIVYRVQILPAMDGLGLSPGAPPQPDPTGETTTIGTQTMVTRAGWGAADPDMNAPGENGLFDAENNPQGWLIYPDPLAGWLDTIVIHHTALDFLQGPREIQRAHQATRGYADIAYHYLIDSFGILYEGRPIAARGAHIGGFNTGSIGIVLVGNFEVVPILSAPVTTLLTLVQYLTAEYTITHLAGHRDFQPGQTVCPGDNLEAMLGEIASQSGLILGTGGYQVPEWLQE